MAHLPDCAIGKFYILLKSSPEIDDHLMCIIYKYFEFSSQKNYNWKSKVCQKHIDKAVFSNGIKKAKRVLI